MAKNHEYIAMPVENNKIVPDLFHRPEFVQYKVDKINKKVLDIKVLDSAPFETKKLGTWLSEKMIDVLIYGGLNKRVRKVCDREGVGVISGVPANSPKQIITDYLENKLDDHPNLETN